MAATQGFAGEGKTEVAKDFIYYDDYSLWDTFRAVHPLFTIALTRTANWIWSSR